MIEFFKKFFKNREIEQEQKSENKSSDAKSYFTAQFSKVKLLSKKYYNFTAQYLEKIRTLDYKFFTGSSYTANVLISKYWNTSPTLLRKIFQYDGFHFEKHYTLLPTEEKINEVVLSLISELTNKIKSENEWTNNETFPCLLYFIIRNTIMSQNPYSFLIPNGRKNYTAEMTEVVAEQQKINEGNITYFQENSTEIVEKYFFPVRNFIDKLSQQGYKPFERMMNDIIGPPESSILVSPYRKSNSQLLLNAIKRDGLDSTGSLIIDYNFEKELMIHQLTDIFVQGLKKRIKENNEWKDDSSLSLLLYTIIRNNVIKHYHDIYLSKYGFESISEFCTHLPNADVNQIIFFVYYYIYETDISFPFFDTYCKIMRDITSEGTKKSKNVLENELFNTSEHRVISTENPATNTLSPIERIDRMSGAEFELYMTQYFQSQGYKTTHTPISGDYGIDLIIENDFGKIGVQAKCYSNKVSLDAVQQVVAGLRHYGLSSGIVITNNYFQPSAIRLAADNNITLWNRDKLIEKLGK